MNITLLGVESGEEDLSKTIQYFKETHPVTSWKTFGFFDDDYIKVINKHWLQFLPPHKTNHYVLATLYALIMTTGWSGNAFVIFMFLRCPSLRTPANTLVMNLAISDLLMMSKMPIFIFNSVNLGPALGKIGCQIFGFVGGLSGTVSICTLAAISFDRYYVIQFPLNMRFTSLRAKICIVIVWCYSAIFSCIPLLNLKFGSYVPEGYLTSCSFDYLSTEMEAKIFIFVFFIAAWFLPFVLITFCYVNILKTVLHTRNPTRTDSESSRHMKVEGKRRQEVKLALTIFLIIVLWFTAWTPYSVVALLGILGREDLIPPLASMVPALFCKTAACIDPFVYVITNQKFMGEVRKLFTRSVSREPRASVRVWTMQTPTERNKSVKQKEFHHSCQASEEVEEEIIPIPGPIRDISTLQRMTLETDTAKPEMEMEMTTSSHKPAWWYKPDFSNRKSSLRDLARKVRQSSKSDSCEYCEEPSKLE